MSDCTYINNVFTKHITEKINVIFECGSRDAIDSLKMFDFYQPKKIFCFGKGGFNSFTIEFLLSTKYFSD